MPAELLTESLEPRNLIQYGPLLSRRLKHGNPEKRRPVLLPAGIVAMVLSISVKPYLRVAMLFCLCWISKYASAHEQANVEHVIVYREEGRFAGWPANHGIWIWGDEILTGFSRGYYEDLGNFHNINRKRPEEMLLVRSKDAGRTWSEEEPQPKGIMIGTAAVRHGTMPEGTTDETLIDLKEPINFTDPNLAFTIRMENKDAGTSRFFYSYDRGQTWKGPFRLPLFGQKGVMARTDYIVDGPRECTLFLTASKENGKEGRPFCARTTDGGLTWNFLSFIAPEPKGVGYSIMPSTVRISPTELVCTVRELEVPNKSWINAYVSRDNGKNWSFLSQPVPDTGEGNPPSLNKLPDGRLSLIYCVRKAPFKLEARLSSDNGQTWSEPMVLRDDIAGRDIGYVRSILRADGKVVAVYYIHVNGNPTRFIGGTIWDPGDK